jgi:hypothetical protein
VHARRLRALPIRLTGRRRNEPMVVGFVDPLDANAIAEVERLGERPVEVAVVEESVDVNGRRLDVAEARGEVTSRSADGRREVDAVTPRAIAVEVREGQTWPVEGLVGQVNGRPWRSSRIRLLRKIDTAPLGSGGRVTMPGKGNEEPVI